MSEEGVALPETKDRELPVGYTYNDDIEGLSFHAVKIIGCIQGTGSANQNNTDKVDADALLKQVQDLAIELKLAYNSEPIAKDSGLRTMAIAKAPQEKIMQNHKLFRICRMMRTFLDELTRSESARRASWIEPFEQKPLMARLNRVSESLRNLSEIEPKDRIGYPQMTPVTDVIEPSNTRIDVSAKEVPPEN